MGVFEELKDRGLIAQLSDEEQIRDLLNNGKITFYIGFDPTADSLHVGHMLQLIIMSRLQKAGHRPIVVLGGGTTMVGDPSGRTDMRKMLTLETIMENAEKFKAQMRRFIDFEDSKALMVNNADWLLKLNYVEFLRDVGVHFSVNRMLTAECFKSRYEKGLTFIEFNYMLMQSYDFLRLFEDYGCILQCGGDDQWSNILSGIDLIRRKHGKTAYCMTFQLLTTSDGRKMGKTAAGAVWLDPAKTPPYDFYQYWRNVDDADVIRCMKMLTFMPLDEIARYEGLGGSELNRAKERLAFELTKLVHGEDEAQKAKEAAGMLFGAGGDISGMPTTKLTEEDFTCGAVSVLDLLIKTGLTPSKGEGRRLIDQGGVMIDDKKVTSAMATVSKEAFSERGHIIIKKGKKAFHRVII